jgi:hypothetical protein
MQRLKRNCATQQQCNATQLCNTNCATHRCNAAVVQRNSSATQRNCATQTVQRIGATQRWCNATAVQRMLWFDAHYRRRRVFEVMRAVSEPATTDDNYH